MHGPALLGLGQPLQEGPGVLAVQVLAVASALRLGQRVHGLLNLRSARHGLGPSPPHTPSPHSAETCGGDQVSWVPVPERKNRTQALGSESRRPGAADPASHLDFCSRDVRTARTPVRGQTSAQPLSSQPLRKAAHTQEPPNRPRAPAEGLGMTRGPQGTKETGTVCGGGHRHPGAGSPGR